MTAAPALAVVQARMSSRRCPGKVLADIDGEPMLVLLLRRLARAGAVSRIVVATTTGTEDDAVAELAAASGAEVHRGPRDDVLARVRAAAGTHEGPVVRITGDCPLVDPTVVDAVLERFRAVDVAYASNVEPRSFPKGLDVEVIDHATLAWVDRHATDAADREHVTALVRRDPVRFPRVNVACDRDFSELRWTVDYEEDLEFVRRVAARLGDRRHLAGLDDMLRAARDVTS